MNVKLINYSQAHPNCNKKQIVNIRVVCCALDDEIEANSDYVSITEVLVNRYIPAFPELSGRGLQSQVAVIEMSTSGAPRKASESVPALKLCKYVIIYYL